jgi:hypothetical protein
MTLSHTGRFSVSPDVISQEYMGETMLLHVKKLVYIRLDKLAGRVWQLLEHCDDFETVHRELKAAGDLPEEKLESFLNGCLASFQRARLISLDPE